MLRDRSHAALTGLGEIVRRGRYYKHVAPMELAEMRWSWHGRFGCPGWPNQAASVDGAIPSLFLIGRRWRGASERGR